MKKTILRTVSILATAALIATVATGCKGKKRGHIFAGGPQGGTYKYAASGISILLKDNLKMNITTQGSEGSQQNIRTANAGKATFNLFKNFKHIL